MDGPHYFVARVKKDRCVDCGFCRSVLACPDPQACTSCGVCVAGCPNEARELVPEDTPRTTFNITVNGQALTVPERITVKRALELAGIDPQIQLCVLDDFPTFRRQDLRRPRLAEMLEVKRILEGEGLRTVVVQTAVGHVGPR